MAHAWSAARKNGQVPRDRIDAPVGCLLCGYIGHIAKAVQSEFQDRPDIIDFGGLGSPGGGETLQKGGGRGPPPFWRVSRPPGAAQTPKIDDFRSVKKGIPRATPLITQLLSSLVPRAAVPRGGSRQPARRAVPLGGDTAFALGSAMFFF